MLQRLGRVAEQDRGRTFAGPPMKRIGWSEQYHLWRSHRASQMHGRGINRNEQACVLEQRRQGEEIYSSREIKHRNVQCFADGGYVGAFEFITAAG